MKKAIILSIFAIVLFILPAKAQIEKEVIPNTDSTQTFVSEGRETMIDKLKEKDYSSFAQLYHSLEDKTLEKENSPFDYTEYLYINLLLENWEILSAFMKDYNESEHIVPFQVRDKLKDHLFDRIVESSDSLLIAVRNSAIEKDGKSAIELLIRLMKSYDPGYLYYRLLDQHNRKFTRSQYSDFVNYYLPAPIPKEAYAFSMGSGNIFPTGKFGESFSDRQSFYASMDVNYNRLFGSIYAQAAGLKLKVPYTLDIDGEKIDYLKDDIYNYQDFGVKFGCFMVRSNRFHLGPFVSVNGILLKTTDFDFWERLEQKMEDDENWEYKVINSFCFGGGMHSEIKLFEKHKSRGYASDNDSYLSIKADAGYNYITKHDVKLFRGNTWYYTVALVYGIGIF